MGRSLRSQQSLYIFNNQKCTIFDGNILFLLITLLHVSMRNNHHHHHRRRRHHHHRHHRRRRHRRNHHHHHHHRQGICILKLTSLYKRNRLLYYLIFTSVYVV